MSLFSRLFGGGAKPETPAEMHEGFRIVPTPLAEGGTYRLSARIEKEIDGETRVHTLLRADTFQNAEEAARFSVLKARQVIDQMGEAIFR